MKKIDVNIRDYYIEEVVKIINQKYNISIMDAIRSFVKSKTYQIFQDAEYAMWEFAPLGIFDMWESESVTGDPRNSLYLRGN